MYSLFKANQRQKLSKVQTRHAFAQQTKVASIGTTQDDLLDFPSVCEKGHFRRELNKHELLIN